MDFEIKVTDQKGDSIQKTEPHYKCCSKEQPCPGSGETPIDAAMIPVTVLVWFPLILYLVLSLFQWHYYQKKILKPKALADLGKQLAGELNGSFQSDQYSVSLLQKENLKGNFLLDLMDSTLTITPKIKQEFKAGFARNKAGLSALKRLNRQMLYLLSKHLRKTIPDIIDEFYERVYQTKRNQKILSIIEKNISHTRSVYTKPKSAVFFFHLVLNFLIGSICGTLIYCGLRHEKIDLLIITIQTSLLVTFCLLYKFFRKF